MAIRKLVVTFLNPTLYVYTIATRAKTMNRYFKSNRFSLFLLSLLTLTIAVKSVAREKNLDGPAKVNGPSATYAPDDLYVLSTTTSEFTALRNKKLVFKFTHVREETLTLHGWRARGLSGRSFGDKDKPDQPSPAPVIKLSSTTTVACKYTSDLYFGDVVLSHKNIKKIKKAIGKDSSKKYVLFIPEIDKEGNVRYKIFLNDTNDKTLTATDTRALANPSPPKNFQ
jgi:hypothetical protein